MKKIVTYNLIYLAVIVLSWLIVDMIYVKGSIDLLFGVMKLSDYTNICMKFLPLLIVPIVWPLLNEYRAEKKAIIVLSSLTFQYFFTFAAIVFLGFNFHLIIGGGM